MSAGRRNEPTDESAQPPGPVTILVADDDPDMRLYVRRCLRTSAHLSTVILEAGNGEDALGRLRQGDVDLLITDVVMPRMDGFALCRAVRQDASLSHVLILFLTGELSPREFEEHAGDLGHVEMLAKPFNADQLGEKVAQVLRNASRLDGSKRPDRDS